MLRPYVVDVMIVYTSTVARSAAEFGVTSPFREESYNAAYAYFLRECKRQGLVAALTTTADITSAGTSACYWTYTHKAWSSVKSPAYARQIFDKFAKSSTKHKDVWSKLFGSGAITPFINQANAALFGDKLVTYQYLSQFMIPTVAITQPTRASVVVALSELAKLVALHPTPEDFERGIIMKDRHGSGGNKIFKITSNCERAILGYLDKYPKVQFVLQPYVLFDKGFIHDGVAANTDIRLIYNNGTICQTYIRRSRGNDFRCNLHQGGTLTGVKTSEIPTKVLAYAQRITVSLDKSPSLHTLDFLISNAGTVYFLEGNISPGLFWDPRSNDDVAMTKALIRTVVTELRCRINASKLVNEQFGSVGLLLDFG